MSESMTKVLDILHLEDDPADAELVRTAIEESGLESIITHAGSRIEFETALTERPFDIILSDYSLPSFDGSEALEIAKDKAPETPFIFVSGTLGEEAAIECLLKGAIDYVMKGRIARLAPAIRRSMNEAEAHRKLKAAEKQREAAVSELKQSEARFRGVLESAPDAAIIVDSTGTITFANRQAERAFGFESGELAGESLDTLVPQRFKEMHSRHVDGFKGAPHARGMNSGIEITGRRKDGSEFPADIMLSPIRMEGEMSVLAMIRDVTHSKEIESALREREELFRGIFESSPMPIYTVSPEGMMLTFNHATTKLLGYSRDELKNMHFNDFTHPDDIKLGTDRLTELLAGRTETFQFEKRYLRRNGETIYVHLTTAAIRNEDRSLRYSITIAEDITQRWHAEELLRRSEERYRSLVDSARDAIYTLSTGAIILSLSPAFETLTGWKREEWLGRSFTDLIHPEDRERAANSFRETLAGKLTDFIQYRIATKSGSYIVGEFSAARYVLEDGSGGVLGIARDVTSQLVLEEQLRQSQKMESIGTLAGGIAHDFNNILGIIIGYTSLSLKSIRRDTPLARNISTIEKAAQRGVGLVRQLLLFARKQERFLQTVDMRGIVSDTYKMIKETFPRVISIDLRAAETELPVHCDSNEIHQGILNLCVNARDAMMARPDGDRSGGTLTIGTGLAGGDKIRSVHPEAMADSYVEVIVRDTGIGMDEDTKSRIFEPFYTTKERGKGTGLGLSTVYGIIRSYDGFVDVESKVGEGTTFTLLLPLSEGAAKTSETGNTQKDDALYGNERVLIVEDEPGLRELVEGILAARGYEVLTAEDGQRGLAAFLEHKDIDLVVSDIGLPKVGGLDLFEAIKKVAPGIRVILVSGFVDESDRQRMKDAGVDAFVQKPYKPVELLRKIREVLDKY